MSSSNEVGSARCVGSMQIWRLNAVPVSAIAPALIDALNARDGKAVAYRQDAVIVPAETSALSAHC
jgi:hypothetical protein